ncbi:MAG: response regulator [Candidatus Omnitrophota bacterium]
MPLKRLSRKILVVEDEKDIAETLVWLLKDEGFSAIAAKDGQEALKKIKTTAFDLVLLDTRLPKISGFEVCRRIRADAKNRDVPVIVMSAFAESEMRSPYGPLGVKHYFIKPFDFNILKTTIENILVS